MTERQLFFELLHKARELKEAWRASSTTRMRRTYFLAGYQLGLREHLDVLKAGQNIADVWKHQRSGAE